MSPFDDAWFAAAAQSAYEAYGHNTGNTNYQGGPMPAFADLPQKIQVAWEVAARQVWGLTRVGLVTSTAREDFENTARWAGWLPTRFQVSG